MAILRTRTPAIQVPTPPLEGPRILRVSKSMKESCDLRYPNSLCFKVGEPPKMSNIVHLSREAVDFKAPHILETYLNLRRFRVEGFLAAMAVMLRELKVKTLDGGDLTVEVMPTNTIKELKAMLHEKKHCEDPIEHKILKVKVLADGLFDDDQTLESAELLHPEAEVTAIFCRNEVEAATKKDIHAEGLLQVNIPCSLTEISARAFGNCKQVVKVAIPESVTTIGDDAFEGCESLASITIPESVTAIGMGAFSDCSSLESITIPESVTAIGDNAFFQCVSLTSITIPESVTAIGIGAFSGCESLESITIPESVTAIGGAAFADCRSLKSITIPESVAAIGDCAFEGCRSLKSIAIPEFVTDIGMCAFRNCESLASITIPESVTALGNCAFAGCQSLASISIPKSLREDGKHAFDQQLQAVIQHV